MPFAQVQVRAGSIAPAAKNPSIPANGSWTHRTRLDPSSRPRPAGSPGSTQTIASASSGGTTSPPAARMSPPRSSRSDGATATRGAVKEGAPTRDARARSRTRGSGRHAHRREAGTCPHRPRTAALRPESPADLSSRFRERQSFLAGIDDHGVAVLEGAVEQSQGQLVLDLALYQT